MMQSQRTIQKSCLVAHIRKALSIKTTYVKYEYHRTIDKLEDMSFTKGRLSADGCKI